MQKSRFLALALAVLLLVSVFSGCKAGEEKESSSSSGAEAGPLRILVDIDVGVWIHYDKRHQTLNKYRGKDSFLQWIEKLGGPKKKTVSLQYLPLSGAARENAITNLRTEIMAGGGPDVFVTFAGTAWEHPANEPLTAPMEMELPVFPYPQQAMERGMFLKLDEYLPKAQFMKLENLPAPLAEAGQYEGSQYIFPMSYFVPVVCFDSADMEQPALSDTMTWEEMAGGAPELQRATGIHWPSNWSGAPLWPLIENGELTFTEEELFDFIAKKKEAIQTYASDSTAPRGSENTLCVGMAGQHASVTWISECQEGVVTTIPLYSKGGGYGAAIDRYVAINANTDRPEDAFFFIDYLLSKECQTSKFYRQFTYANSVPSMIGDVVLQGFEKPENYQTYCELRDHISFAEFDTPLNFELADLLREILNQDDGHMETTVRNAYNKMKAMLDEA